MSSQKAMYKTEPFKMWNEAKQLRQQHFEEYRDIKQKGGKRILSATGISLTIHAGFKDAVIMGAEP